MSPAPASEQPQLSRCGQQGTHLGREEVSCAVQAGSAEDKHSGPTAAETWPAQDRKPLRSQQPLPPPPSRATDANLLAPAQPAEE